MTVESANWLGSDTGLVGADVTVTLEIEAHIAGGTPESVVKVVTANGRDLKFKSAGFEQE